jgi:hypothetical protein
LSFILQCVFEPHKAAMGFVRNRSIVDNAKLHAGSNYVYNIDLKDFFPSVDQARVWKCLQLKPFGLKASNVEKGDSVFLWEDFKREYLKTEEPVTFNVNKLSGYAETPMGPFFASNFDQNERKIRC